MASTIQVRVDDDLKAKSDELFKDLGTDTTTEQPEVGEEPETVVLSADENPFGVEIKKINENPYKALSEVEMLEKLERAREHATQGMYKEAHNVSHDMRAKYGL